MPPKRKRAAPKAVEEKADVIPSANKFYDDICAALPETKFELKLNENGKPKKGSFEIFVVVGEKRVEIWTGIKLGPPRKDKFPEAANLVDAVLKAMK
ncbi:unnamed protein product [Diamesa hyperborea]